MEIKHIGILAHSFEGAALCYRTTCLEGVRRLGAHLHPEVTMTARMPSRRAAIATPRA